MFFKLIIGLRPKYVEDYITLSIFLSTMGMMVHRHINKILGNTVFMVGAVIFILSLLVHHKRNPFKGISSNLLCTLVIWTIWNTFYSFFIIGGWEFTQGTIKNLLLPFLFPFFLYILPQNRPINFRYMLNCFAILSVCYVAMFPFSVWSMLHWDFNMNLSHGQEWGDEGTYGDFIMNSTLGISVLLIPSVLIYFKRYFIRRVWFAYMIIFVSNLFLQLFMARRGGVAITLLTVFSVWALYLLQDRVSKVKTIFMGIVISLFAVMIFYNYADSLFATLLERGVEDTRSGVEHSFYQDMNKAEDWIIGRGWFGEYYDPIFRTRRHYIESGYLTLIMRGGIIYLILYVSLLLYSSFRGLLLSNNIFVKSFSVVILIYVISLYPFGIPDFDFNMFVIWIGLYFCNNRYILSLNDKEIYCLYFNDCRKYYTV